MKLVSKLARKQIMQHILLWLENAKLSLHTHCICHSTFIATRGNAIKSLKKQISFHIENETSKKEMFGNRRHHNTNSLGRQCPQQCTNCVNFAIKTRGRGALACEVVIVTGWDPWKLYYDCPGFIGTRCGSNLQALIHYLLTHTAIAANWTCRLMQSQCNRPCMMLYMGINRVMSQRCWRTRARGDFCLGASLNHLLNHNAETMPITDNGATHA